MKFCKIIELSGDNQALLILNPQRHNDEWTVDLVFVFEGGKIVNAFGYESLEQAQKAFDLFTYNDVQNLYFALESMFMDEDTRGKCKIAVEKQIIKLHEKVKGK